MKKIIHFRLYIECGNIVDIPVQFFNQFEYFFTEHNYQNWKKLLENQMEMDFCKCLLSFSKLFNKLSSMKFTRQFSCQTLYEKCQPPNTLVCIYILYCFVCKNLVKLFHFLCYTIRMPDYVINGIPIIFPFEPYEVQRKYMEKIIECLDKSANSVLESPTGLWWNPRKRRDFCFHSNFISNWNFQLYFQLILNRYW